MKTGIGLVLCLFAFAGASFSQQGFTVISNNGLKLRETPDRNGRVLAVAPFGAKVAVLTKEKGDYGQVEYDPPARRDTIGQIFPTRFNNRKAGHAGYWWKVRYSGKSGYMFSGFLADSALLHNSRQKELNNHFRLRTTEGNASATNNPEFDPGWHWYGLFQQPDSQFAVKKVNPRYAVRDYTDEQGIYDFHSRAIVILADQSEQPLFIVGARDTLKEQSGIGGFWSMNDPQAQYLPNIPNTGEFDPVFMKKHGIEVVREKILVEDRWPMERWEWYILGEGGRRQRAAPLKVYDDYEAPLSYLVWAGDLDGDGKTDYIFSAMGEMGYYVLYLSTQLGNGAIAKPAAVLWTWYTC